MIEKRFKFDRDTVATNIKTPIVFDNEEMTIGEVLNKLNELHNENISLKQELDNIYLLIGRGDWSGLADYFINNEPEVKYSIEEILEELK